MKPSLSLLLILSATSAMAQGADNGAAAAPQQPRWGLGIGAAVSEGIYAGEGARVTPFPLVSYEGERFFWRGIGGGAHLFKQGAFSVDATLSARMDGVDQKDFGRRELAERGIDQSIVEDRDNGLDAGVALHWRGPNGHLEFGIKGDVSGASKGYEASVKYAYPFQVGGTRISPHVGVSHLSKKLVNYYFGTSPLEVARGAAHYQPGSATVPRIGIDVVHPFAKRWAVIGNVSYKHLPGKISDSPLVEKDTNGNVSGFIGLSRSF
jgi:outer membrane protein